MKKVLFILSVVILTSCGPSQEEKQAAEMERQRVEMERQRVEMEKQRVEMEKQRVEKQASEKLAKEKANRTAAVTCAIMGESRNVDASIRVEKINEARDKIGGEPFLDGDYAIKEAFEYGLCQELVLNEDYDKRLQPLKEAKRERERIAAEKRAEELRIAAEKQRIADSKPTVKEEFYPNGELKSRTNYQAINVGVKKHGLEEHYHENGQLIFKRNYKDGKPHGLVERYHENGQLSYKTYYKDGEQQGLEESYDENGKEDNWSPWCYQNGVKVDMSNCK